MSVSHRTMVAGVVAFAAVVLSGNLQARAASETASTQVSQSKTLHEPRTSTRRVAPHADPFELISAASLLRFVDALTAIEAHSGWRTCGSSGELQAFDFVDDRLQRLRFLVGTGLEIEVQNLRTAVGVEFHESTLVLNLEGLEVEVPADAIAGHPYSPELTALYDSDGDLSDRDFDPVTAEGPVAVFSSPEQIQSLGAGDLQGVIAFVDFSLIDRVFMSTADAYGRISPIFGAGAAGIVVVTEDSLVVGESHGSFILDSSVFSYIQADPPIPLLVVGLEALGAAGIGGWQALEEISSARLTWDVDMVMPGSSNNLVARIPGADPSQAVVLSAHLDSPNSPGALDNGSGSAALLEVARVLDRARVVPPVDLYLVWFGCHEKGMFGSAHFAATHQELLDRTIAIIELDAMARPLEGLDDPVNLESWSFSRLGNDELPLPDYLELEMAVRGTEIDTWDFHWLLSDITGFVPYNVPNALLDNLDFGAYDQIGSYHYMAHWHTPYDVAKHARAEAAKFEELTRVLLSAALDTGRDQPELRVTPPAEHRAVFVATHTESVHMTPLLFTDLGTILAWEGLDVDLVPWGGPLATADLENAAMVVVLPVHDYPSELSGVADYDESWSAAEIQILSDYVDDGGLLVLTNSSSRLGPFARPRDDNEDWTDLNDLAGVFGIRYTGSLAAGDATVVPGHPLVEGVASLFMIEGNALALSIEGRPFSTLATAEDGLVAAVVGSGDNGGEVIALADIGLLVSMFGEPTNFEFWQNLARYALDRDTP